MIASASAPWVDEIGRMLLHSLWQGTAIAMALYLALRLLRRAPAQARYLAGCIAMALMIALPTASLRWPETIPSMVSAPPAPTMAGGPAISEHDAASITRPAEIEIVGRLHSICPVIVGLWLAGAGVLSLRLLGGWIQARRWVRRDTRALAGPWIDRLERLQRRMGLHRVVVLLESARVEVPMVVGWLRPAILVPASALSGLAVPELEAIFAHELAHIRRHDYLVNIFQCVVETLVFYHPATWWITGVIRREREHCCDDIAVVACRDRLTYARALASMEGLRAPAFSPSPAANGGILLARVRRILEPQEESMRPVRMLVALAMVLAVAPIWLARADDDRPAKADPGSTRPSVDVPRDYPPLPELPAVGKERNDPFPNRSYADIITSIEEMPTGRSMIQTDSAPVSDDGTPSEKPTPDQSRAIGLVRRTSKMALEAQARPAEAGGLSSPATQPQADEGLKGRVPTVADLQGSSDDPPGETEIWANVPKTWDERYPRSCEVQRNNVRIVIEKIGDKADAVKIYPLAGPCQLVHKHYKCTVYYDELYWSHDPVPFQHVEHKVEVVYINKDFLRRSPGPDQPPKGEEDPLDRISRELEELKRKGRLDRQEQDQIIDQMIRELKDLKRSRLGVNDDAQAEKTFREGMYYRRVCKVASANFYFDKSLQRWPRSPWAIKAREQLARADRAALPLGGFNFLVSGYY